MDGYPAFSRAMDRRHAALARPPRARVARVLLMGADRSCARCSGSPAGGHPRGLVVVDAEHRDALAVQFFNHVPQRRGWRAART